MNETIAQHLARLKSATTNKLDRTNLSKWVTDNTYIGGSKFSFKNHEFQERIINDPSQEIVIIKSAQLGVSEMSLRMALGLVMLMPDSFAVGYIFPTAGFSSQYSKTRLNPIIQSSPALRAAINSEDLDSAEVKTFGPGRALYAKGAATGNSAISTSLDCCFFDEYSFMDQGVAGDYTSRLIHSKYKMKVKLSTPTFPGDPIHSAYLASTRWLNMCKCDKCGHDFYPDYYEHVKIPGFSHHLDEVTSENLHTVDYRNAALLCPACGLKPSLQPEHRQWVCENPSEGHVATGYRLSPFDAPNVITVPYLVEASTAYASKAKFRQFNLGMPAADAESGITDQDLEAIGVEGNGSPYTTHVMGIDLGLTCHFLVGGIGADLKLGVVHMERVPLARFRERYFALKAQYRITITVSDIQPYTDLVMSLCAEDPNLYGASYVTRGGLELFDVRQQDADATEALGQLRQVSVNRNAVFDRILVEVREGGFWVRKTSEWDTFKGHLQDMKRAQATLRNGEFTSMWQKSTKGRDHYHHGLLYLWIASQMRGVAMSGGGFLGPPVGKFKVKAPLTAEQARDLQMQRLRGG